MCVRVRSAGRASDTRLVPVPPSRSSAGGTKLFVPKEKLAGMGGSASRWVEGFSPGALRAIGAIEFLAAAGLILPAALGIAPVLVPLAATGAVLLFAGAVIMRLRRGERATIIGDLVYLAMAAFVAWGRLVGGTTDVEMTVPVCAAEPPTIAVRWRGTWAGPRAPRCYAMPKVLIFSG